MFASSTKPGLENQELTGSKILTSSIPGDSVNVFRNSGTFHKLSLNYHMNVSRFEPICRWFQR